MNAAGTHVVVEPVTLRPAREPDCVRVWEWNFAPDVRRLSKRSEPVRFNDHARWYAERIGQKHEPMWIIEVGPRPAGVIRLDGDATLGTRLSIALAGSMRGRGIGRRAIAQACRAWSRPVFAEIFAENTASRACFEACGFALYTDHDTLLTYRWTPETP